MNPLHLIMQQLASWRSILDIAVISGGRYVLSRTLIKPETCKIVAGILFGFPFLIIAAMLRLELGGWLFQNVSHVARPVVRHSST